MSDLTRGLVAALADRYLVERELGRRRMATVHLAHDQRHERRGGKVLRPRAAVSRLVLLLSLSLGGTQCSAPPAVRAPNPSHSLAVRFLTADSAVTDYWPAISPDDRTVLFSRSLDGGKTWALYTVPMAGGAVHRLADPSLPASATRPNWSAHSGRIAFTAEESDGKVTVWIMAANGTQARRVTADGLSDEAWYPSWYPDDEHVAVVDVPGNEVGVVKRVDLKRHVATALTEPAKVLAGMPSVSPDGNWIAFAGQENLGQHYDQSRNSIWLLESDRRLRNTIPGQGRTPAWSPDGQWLAFESNRGSSSDLYAAFTVRRDGSELRQVTEYELNANHPVWSRDGKLLVVSARHTKGLAATGIAIIQLPER